MPCCAKKGKEDGEDGIVAVGREESASRLLNKSQNQEEKEGSDVSKKSQDLKKDEESTNVKIDVESLIEKNEVGSKNIGSEAHDSNTVERSDMSSSLKDVSVPEDVLTAFHKKSSDKSDASILEEEDENSNQKLEDKNSSYSLKPEKEEKHNSIIGNSEKTSNVFDNSVSSCSDDKKDKKKDKMLIDDVADFSSDTSLSSSPSSISSSSSSSSLSKSPASSSSSPSNNLEKMCGISNNKETDNKIEGYESDKEKDEGKIILNPSDYNYGDDTEQGGLELMTNRLHIENFKNGDRDEGDILGIGTGNDHNKLDELNNSQEPKTIKDKLSTMLSLKPLTENEKEAARERFGWSKSQTHLTYTKIVSNGENKEDYYKENGSVVATSPKKLVEGINPLIARLSPKLNDTNKAIEGNDDDFIYKGKNLSFNDGQLDISPNIRSNDNYMFSQAPSMPNQSDGVNNNHTLGENYPNGMNSEVEELDMLIKNEEQLLEQTRASSSRRQRTNSLGNRVIQSMYQKDDSNTIRRFSTEKRNGKEIEYFDSPSSPSIPITNTEMGQFPPVDDMEPKNGASKVKVININLDSVLKDEKDARQEMISYQDSSEEKLGNGLGVDDQKSSKDSNHDPHSTSFTNFNQTRNKSGSIVLESKHSNIQERNLQDNGNERNASEVNAIKKSRQSSSSESSISDSLTNSLSETNSLSSTSSSTSSDDSDSSSESGELNLSSDISLTFGRMMKKSRRFIE